MASKKRKPTEAHSDEKSAKKYRELKQGWATEFINHMDIIVASGLLADNFQAMLLTIASAQGEDLRKIAKTLAGEWSQSCVLARALERECAEKKEKIASLEQDLAAARSQPGGNQSLVPSELREEIKDLQQQLADSKGRERVNAGRVKHWMNEYGKLAREVARRAPEALGDELPLNPLARESKADDAEGDVLVSDTEEISDYSSLSQARAVPMEDDDKLDPVHVTFLRGERNVNPSYKLKKGDILILQPKNDDVLEPVWLGTFQGFTKNKKECKVKYFALEDWEFKVWEGPAGKANLKDAVMGVVDRVPAGKQQIKAFFACVSENASAWT